MVTTNKALLALAMGLALAAVEREKKAAEKPEPADESPAPADDDGEEPRYA
jgi:hypothetical protein